VAIQDKTGNKYEQLIETSLEALGFIARTNKGNNYIHPSKREPIVIPDTYIQADFIIRQSQTVKAVLYVTHWSNTRSSKYKYWRTWEEQAQQKLSVGPRLLSVNCVFEALPEETEPKIFLHSYELPPDPARDNKVPIAFRGWYPAVTFALVDSFDVTLAFPVGYAPIDDVSSYDVGEHDANTTNLVRAALKLNPKRFLRTQWTCLSKVRNNGKISVGASSLTATKSRYRIGLLHVYLYYRLAEIQASLQGKRLLLTPFVEGIIASGVENVDIQKLARSSAFKHIGYDQTLETVQLLSQVYVRTGEKAKAFCDVHSLTHGSKTIHRITYNVDLQVCLEDLVTHISDAGFSTAMEKAFSRYDSLWGVVEALNDLADRATVVKKEAFVRRHFASLINDPAALAKCLQSFSGPTNKQRQRISSDIQNWVFEILIYMFDLNIAEDLYTRITPIFEKSGHQLRPHVPMGDHTLLLLYLLQGKNPCDSWSARRGRRTLSEDEFIRLSWITIATAITTAARERESRIQDKDACNARYLGAKARRIISAEANGLEILIDHYLGDICYLQFSATTKKEKEALRVRTRGSWQTEVTAALWNAPSLGTWMEGVSHDGNWLIKIQSAQDNNEGHKTKELAGRCRALRLAWSHGRGPNNRDQWRFSLRQMPKLALALDGDWSVKQKQNLYEAGWDWIGDVAQLENLRELITNGAKT
jgi:hypothetical protein